MSVHVNSALQKAGLCIPSSNYIGGLGGRDISREEIEGIFADLQAGVQQVKFLGLRGEAG